VRRAAPPPTLRVDPTGIAAHGRLEPGPRGLRLSPADPPDGPARADGPPLRPVRGAPVPAHELAVAAGGRLAVAAAVGVARSLRLPDLAVAFDRRPPGLMRVAAAALANAGLLQSDDGWRAVVLPSMGDLAADLGPGPVALRSDGRRVAAVAGGAVREVDLPDGTPAGEGSWPEPPGALAYGAEGELLTAVGPVLHGPSGPLGDAGGSAIVALAAAARAPRALARHADGSCSLWSLDGGGRLGAWPGPLAGPCAIALSDDGMLAALGTPFATPAAACVVRAEDGALVHHLAEARAIALAPGGDAVLVAGEWGTALLATPKEES
jgi:hypothetical protein